MSSTRTAFPGITTCTRYSSPTTRDSSRVNPDRPRKSDRRSNTLHRQQIATHRSPIAKRQTMKVKTESSATLPLAEQRAQQQRENNTETNDRPISPFAAQKALIDRHIPYPNARVTEVPISGIDITTIRNVGLPSTRRRTHRSDNGLYSYRGRGVPGLRMADTIPFPPPVAPQGRPVQSAGEEACGRIDIVYAMERIGGEACLECEVDCHE
jgi:hypothetical protein